MLYNISNHWSFPDKEGETFSMEVFHCFSTRSEAECGNFEEILWKLSGKSEWKTFPLEYPENGSWLQIYLSSSIFGVSPSSLLGRGGGLEVVSYDMVASKPPKHRQSYQELPNGPLRLISLQDDKKTS